METKDLVEKSLGENLVVKANALIEASYSLSLSGQRVIAMALSTVDSRKKIEEEQYIEITVEQAKDLFQEQEPQGAYYMLRKGGKDLVNSSVEIVYTDNPDEESGLVTSWLQSYKYDKKQQKFSFLFAREVIPYISQLHDNFTKYRLKNIVRLTSTYAIRLYEYCCEWVGQGRMLNEVELTELRRMLAVPDDKYERFSQLKERVVDIAVNQINTYTDFMLEVAFRKAGRSFHSIQIRIEVVSGRSDNPTIRKIQNAQHNATQKIKRLKREMEQAEQEMLIEGMARFERLENGTKFLDGEGVEYVKDDGMVRTILENRYVGNLNGFVRKWYIDEKIKIVG